MLGAVTVVILAADTQSEVYAGDIVSWSGCNRGVRVQRQW